MRWRLLRRRLSISSPRMAVRSHLLMCRHCRRFIRQMRLTQATVRHLPEGQGPELDRLAAHLSELRKDAARR